jgi:hypothetical protein
VIDDLFAEGPETVVVTLIDNSAYDPSPQSSAVVTITSDDSLDGTLVGYWKLDETSGTTAPDETSHGNDGTLVNGPTWTNGNFDGALSFDGKDDYVDVGTGAAVLGKGGFTLSAWVRTTDTGEQVIIQQRNRASYNGAYMFKLRSGRPYLWTYGDYQSGARIQANRPVNDGQWHHVTAVREDDGTARLYIDGEFDRSHWLPPRTMKPIDVYIGADMRSRRHFFDGMLDDVRIYQRALSADEVRQLSESVPDKLPQVSLTATQPTASEPDQDGQFTMSRTGDISKELTVTIAASGTASGGADYAALGTTVVIPAGASEVVLPVEVIDDTQLEGPENVFVEVTSSTTYRIGSSAAANVVILDDERPPTVSIEATDQSAAEPNDHGELMLRRSGEVTEALTVYFTVSGSAAADADYTSLGTSAVIPVGSSSLAIPVNVIDDELVENDEVLHVNLDANALYQLDAAFSATVTIASDDQASSDPTLVAHWRLDETSGAVATDVAGGNNGVLVNGPAWTSGNFDGGLSFDGRNDYVDVGTGAAVLGKGGFTLSAWVRTTATGEQVILQQRSSASYNGAYMLKLKYGRPYLWTFGDSQSGARVQATRKVNDGQWHHIVAVREDDGTARLYIDGQFDSARWLPPRTMTSINVYIGADLRNNREFYEGSLDDIRIYQRALTADEVRQLAENALP